MSDKMVDCAGYLRPLFDKVARKKVVNHCVKTLKPICATFDAIAVSGYSMALIAPIIAEKLDKDVILVRKNSEDRHSCRTIEGTAKDCRYIIIDDLVDSGSTVVRLMEMLKSRSSSCRYDYTEQKCVGIYLYSAMEGNSDKEIKRRFGVPLLGRIAG